MQAILESFSPAGPMQLMRMFWSCSSSLITCWQSELVSPHNSLAERNLTSPFLIQR